MSSKILLRRGTAAEWSSANPILGTGELGIETDTLKIKIGNGSSTWSQLSSYANVTPAQLTSQINSLISAAPSTLDTLNELAAAINNDASFSTTVNNLLTGKVSKSGGDTITSSTASTVGLIIKGATSQTANLQEWQDSAGTALLRVNSAGQIQAPLDTSVGLVVRAATGNATATITSASGSGTTVTYTATNTFTAGQAVTITGVNPSAYNLSFVTIATANATTFTVTNAATGTYVSGGTATIQQSGNLQQWQTAAGTIHTRITGLGTLQTNNNGSFDMAVFAGSAGATQILAGGSIRQNSNLNNSFGGGTATGVIINLGTFATTNVGLRINGVASQTANLTEWQNSAGTVLAKVDSTGVMSVADLIVNNQTTSATLAVKGSSTSGKFVGLFAENGITPQNSTIGPTIANRMVSVQGNGAAFFMGRDVTNSIEFIMGTSSVGAVFAGAMTAHDLHLRTQNTTRAWVKSAGKFAIGADISTGQLNVTPASSATIGLVVQGIASQTGNLQEWQNNSGTVLAKITASGALDATAITVNGAAISTGSASGLSDAFMLMGA